MLKTVKMSDEKMKFRLHTLLFSVAIFTLTAVGLAFLCYKTLVTPFWFTYVYIVAWALVFAFAIDFLRDLKLSRKKLVLLTFSVMIIAMIVSHSVWAIVTPKWSFSVTTDKSTYSLGESVQITVTLKNVGFIDQSFTSAVDVPFVVSVRMYDITIWYSPYNRNPTEFTIAPHQSLERTFTWNQTDIGFPEREIEPGTYVIVAFTPKVEEGWISITSHQRLFNAYTTINITERLSGD